jgi:hypothetical protein
VTSEAARFHTAAPPPPPPVDCPLTPPGPAETDRTVSRIAPPAALGELASALPAFHGLRDELARAVRVRGRNDGCSPAGGTCSQVYVTAALGTGAPRPSVIWSRSLDTRPRPWELPETEADVICREGRAARGGAARGGPR